MYTLLRNRRQKQCSTGQEISIDPQSSAPKNAGNPGILLATFVPAGNRISLNPVRLYIHLARPLRKREASASLSRVSPPPPSTPLHCRARTHIHIPAHKLRAGSTDCRSRACPSWIYAREPGWLCAPFLNIERSANNMYIYIRGRARSSFAPARARCSAF